MKIHGLPGSAGVYGPTGPRKPGGKKTDGPKPTDQVTLSPEAREALGLRAKLDAAPEVRTEVVEAIRKQIEAGTYNRPASAVAARMARIFDDLA